MGTVCRADQITLGRTVAVKILREELARDETMVKRFHQEARAASRLNHPNTISIIDFGQTSDGLLYLVMEFVRGRTMTEVIRQDFPLPTGEAGGHRLPGPRRAPRGALARRRPPGHQAGQRPRGTPAHGRDLVKIADFGIARFARGRAAEEGRAAGHLRTAARRSTWRPSRFPGPARRRAQRRLLGGRAALRDPHRGAPVLGRPERGAPRPPHPGPDAAPRRGVPSSPSRRTSKP